MGNKNYDYDKMESRFFSVDGAPLPKDYQQKKQDYLGLAEDQAAHLSNLELKMGLIEREHKSQTENGLSAQFSRDMFNVLRQEKKNRDSKNAA